jgi:hypothetical protein
VTPNVGSQMTKSVCYVGLFLKRENERSYVEQFKMRNTDMENESFSFSESCLRNEEIDELLSAKFSKFN